MQTPEEHDWPTILRQAEEKLQQAIEAYGPNSPEIADYLEEFAAELKKANVRLDEAAELESRALALRASHPKKLKSRFLGTATHESANVPTGTESKKCPRCGNDIPIEPGEPLKCGCGWYPNAHRATLAKVALALGFVAAMAAGIWVMTHFYDYFPDNKAADDFVKEAKDFQVQNKAQEAGNAYYTALRVSPKRADIRYKLSQFLLAINHPYEALEEARLAYEMEPNNYAYTFNFCVLLSTYGDFKITSNTFDKVLPMYPKDFQLRLIAAAHYKNQNKLDKAEKALKEATKIQKKGDLCWDSLAGIYQEQNKKKEMLQTVKDGLAANPESAALNYRLGYMYAEAHNPQAVGYLKKAVELNPYMTETVSPVLEAITKSGGRATYLIRLHRQGDSYLVDAVINNKYHVWLQVDTGANMCVMPSRTRSWSAGNLKGMPHIAINGVTGTTLAPIVAIPSLKVGGAEVKNVRAVIHDIRGHGMSEGLLGMTFLEHFEVSMDSKNQRLVLTERTSKLLSK
jgi:clan AA aspartic protease (TIGR02281 family)